MQIKILRVEIPITSTGKKYYRVVTDTGEQFNIWPPNFNGKIAPGEMLDGYVRTSNFRGMVYKSFCESKFPLKSNTNETITKGLNYLLAAIILQSKGEEITAERLVNFTNSIIKKLYPQIPSSPLAGTLHQYQPSQPATPAPTYVPPQEATGGSVPVYPPIHSPTFDNPVPSIDTIFENEPFEENPAEKDTGEIPF